MYISNDKYRNRYKSDFMCLYLFFMYKDIGCIIIAPAKHTLEGSFPLLIGTDEKGTDRISNLLQDPFPGYILIPDVKTSGFLGSTQPVQDPPKDEEITYHHRKKESELPGKFQSPGRFHHLSHG